MLKDGRMALVKYEKESEYAALIKAIFDNRGDQDGTIVLLQSISLLEAKNMLTLLSKKEVFALGTHLKLTSKSFIIHAYKLIREV